MTAEELFAMPGQGRRELIDGVLREMEPGGGQHGEISAVSAFLLVRYAREHGGKAFGAETGALVRHDPDTVRAPDAAYLGPERAATIGETEGYLPEPPDLAVEVLSPHDTYSEVQEKALEWLAAGCRVVLVIDPGARRVTRYRAPDDVVAFAGADAVDCAPAMPAFAPTVAELLGDEG